MTKDEALKLALKSLQKADKINGHPNNQKIIVAIKEALAEPEQESDDLTIAYLSGFYDGKNKDAPQREWVGLTEPEVDEAYKSVSNKEWAIGGLDDARVFFCAIEAKLREKNT
jgi:hypothetical protein